MIKQIIAALIIAGVPNYTYIGLLKPSEIRTVKISVPAGQTTIDVYNPYNETKFDCEFKDTATGFVGLEQKNVVACSGKINTKAPLVIEVKTKNLDKGVVDYWIVRTTL